MSKLSQPNTSLSEARPVAAMSRVNPHAAGVDIGAHETMVCVPGDESTQLGRSFGNYTADLQAIAAWLEGHHMETVAIESTGIYWISLFETLKAAVFRRCLVSARSDQCDRCGNVLEPEKLIDPKARTRDGALELRETEHFYLDPSKLEPEVKRFLKERAGHMREPVLGESLGKIEAEGPKPGQKLNPPAPLFKKLDESLVEEERARLGK